MPENSTEQPNSEPADYKQFKPGDKVRTITGEVRTVWQQRGYQVFVAEETDQTWYHAGQLTAV